MNFMRSELEEDKIIKQVDEMYVHLVDKRKTIISRLQDANKYLLKSKEDLIIIDGNSESLSELKEKFKECLESDAISQLQYEDYINDIDSIKDIDEDISKFSNYIFYNELFTNLFKINKKVSQRELGKIKTSLCKFMKNINKDNLQNLLEYLDLSEEEKDVLKNTDNKKAQEYLIKKYSEKQEKLEGLLAWAEAYNHENEKIKFEKEQKKNKKIIDHLQKINDYELVEENFKKLTSPDTPNEEKNEIRNKYAELIEEARQKEIENLAIEFGIIKKRKEDKKDSKNYNFDDKSSKFANLKARTKEKLHNIGDTLKRNWKKFAVVGSSIILIGALAATIKSCSKKDNKNNNENTNKYSTETMSNYIPEYAHDYEEMKRIYNLTDEDAIAYVNDGHKILEANFFEGASLNDVVKVIEAIRSGELYTEEKNKVTDSFDTTLNKITDDYIFGTISEEDIKKVEAIQYFAKEGSDLDRFLTKYQEHIINILKNPYDINLKNEFYNYINTYASNINNGFIQDDGITTNDKTTDEKAILNNHYDFLIAYDCFVFDTIPLMQGSTTDPMLSKVPGIDDIEEKEYNEYILKLQDLTNKSVGLQEFMQTAINNLIPECQTRSLGGK